MPDRELDLARAQRRVSEALAPSEVVAAAAASLLPRWVSGRTRSHAALFGFAIIGALAWFSYRSRDPWWPSVAVLTPLHVRAMLVPRRQKKDQYLLAITGADLVLTDYPSPVAPVRVLFAGPVQALQLDVRHRRRITTIRCTAADGKLVLYGRHRRALELSVRSDTAALAVLEAFQARGGALTPGTGTLTPIPA